MLYFSYAANLNRAHMARLCPGAKPLNQAFMEGYELTVRRWFNVEPKEGGNVQGGIWRISQEHLARLDSYEDSPELFERRTVREGYREWRIPSEQVEEALRVVSNV